MSGPYDYERELEDATERTERRSREIEDESLEASINDHDPAESWKPCRGEAARKAEAPARAANDVPHLGTAGAAEIERLDRAARTEEETK